MVRRWVPAEHQTCIPTPATWCKEEVTLPDPVDGEIAGRIRSGDLTYREEPLRGFERLPATFLSRFGETESVRRRLVRLV